MQFCFYHKCVMQLWSKHVFIVRCHTIHHSQSACLVLEGIQFILYKCYFPLPKIKKIVEMAVIGKWTILSDVVLMGNICDNLFIRPVWSWKSLGLLQSWSYEEVRGQKSYLHVLKFDGWWLLKKDILDNYRKWSIKMECMAAKEVAL